MILPGGLFAPPAAPARRLRRSASHGEAGYPRIAQDAYFTEPWVTRALVGAVDFDLADYPAGAIWEPACGDGRMARELTGAGYRVIASDLNDWGYGAAGVDFLTAPAPAGIVAIITNPPFSDDLSVRFAERALAATRAVRGRVALLQRHEFDAPGGRHQLFAAPFAGKLVLPRRPVWIAGPKKAAPRVPYAWFLWCWRHRGRPALAYLPDPVAAAPAGRRR